MFVSWSTIAMAMLAVLVAIVLYEVWSRFGDDIDELRKRIQDLEARLEEGEPTDEELDEYIRGRTLEYLAGKGRNPAEIPHEEIRRNILRARRLG